FLRLSVLPSFGGGQRAGARHHDANSTTPLEPLDLQKTAICASAIAGSPDNVREEALEGARSLPPPPSQSTLADCTTSRKMSGGASVETVALRARLRERWFRLEATRKAQRQREAVERELMAAEDGALSSGDNKRKSNAGLTRGHQNMSDQSTDVDNDDSSAENNTDISSKDAAGANAVRGAGRSREVSAAGLAAMRRSKAADAASIEMESASKPSAPSSDEQGISVSLNTEELEETDPAASPPCNDGSAKSVSVNPEEDVRHGGCGGVVVVVLGEGERVQAACEAGKAGLLNDLLVRSAGRAADGKDKLRRTPLHLAAEAGSLECVNLLLKQGTRLDQRDRWRETPLHKAARSGNSAIVKALCAARMKVNIRNRYRETPLLLAVRASSADSAAALLGFGARLDDPDVNGVTPVVQAAMSGQTDLLMVMANSNQAWKSSNREESVPYAMVDTIDPSNTNRSGTVGKRRSLPSPLYRGSANSGKGGSRGNSAPARALSPVHEAAASGRMETLSLLLQLGAALEERDSVAGVEGDTPLGRAVRAGQEGCARLLLDAGAMIGRENARGETPLVIAIRAGQASVAELLVQHGAPLDGGRSHNRLTAADGRAPAGAREKMLARRRVEPLELALREGQLTCAAVLIEGGARISERALKAVKLEPAGAVSPDRSATQTKQTRYAGSSPLCDQRGNAWNGNGTAGSTAAAGATIPLQTDVGRCMSPEISEVAHAAHADGGGLQEDPRCSSDALEGVPLHGCECRQDGQSRGLESCGGAETKTSSGGNPRSQVKHVGGLVDERGRSRAVEPLLAGVQDAGSNGRPQASSSTSAAAVAAASFAATTIAEQTARQPPAIVHWGSKRGEMCVRFWGAGTMAAVVQHLYTGEPPSGVHVDGLGRLLVAAVSLRMPRLMRQVEHLLSAGLSPQKSSTRAARHAEAARLLRAARVLKAKDLEDRCTLYLQENGVFPAVMKLRRELRVPSLHASDVTRGLARLKGSGYLGSGPAHAWSSSGAVSTPSSSDVVTAAKRAVDLSLRKRAVDFDQLVPLLLDPNRCASTLSIGKNERAILLEAALADACPRNRKGVPRGLDEVTPELFSAPQLGQWSSRTRRGCCNAAGRVRGESGRERQAVPLVSNFSAFAHDMGILLRTGVVADVVLILPERLDGSRTVEQAAVMSGAGENTTEEESGRSGEDRQEQDGRKSVTASSTENETATTWPRQSNRFLAHSMILGSRSEKFAAMLRFVRRQDAGSSVASDSSSAETDALEDEDRGRGQAEGWDTGNVYGNGQACSRGDVKQQYSACHDEDEDGDSHKAHKDGMVPSSFQDSYHPSPGQSYRPRPGRYSVRRDPAPREMELHSPLLSPRSLGLFLEFLYTGVLIPSLPTRELSELALIADEYLVPDLTRQAEALLVECLDAAGPSHSPPSMGRTTGSNADGRHSRREDDTASTPLEVLQLGMSLGLTELSTAAARSVLLHLETVSRSEAFEASGMSKRELVVAALEAIRS
ncbi:unnamed protein product, partial [Hapterophycus canaliculatus]